MYKFTLRQINSNLFFFLLFSLLLSIFVFKTYYFSILIIITWLFLEFTYRLPISSYNLSNQELIKIDNKLGLYKDKTLDILKITSPCYGTIKSIETNKDYTRIISTLGMMDVHYQFSPIEGIVKSISYQRGDNYIAYILNKSNKNQNKKTVFTNKKGLEVNVIQYSGFMNSKIQTFVKNDEIVNIGTPYGLLHFDSRVDIVIPNNYKGMPMTLLVKEGDKVQALNTTLCIYS
jgi:phosphatidylserine decarboxylase